MSFKIKVILFTYMYMYCVPILSKNVHISTIALHGPTAAASSKGISGSTETLCFGGFRCVHGRCQKDVGDFLISECMCDPGWAGLLCDQMIVAWKFGDRTQSDVRDDGVKVTTKSLFQRVRDQDQENDALQPQYTTKPPSGVFQKRLENDDVNDVCRNDYQAHPVEERTCTAGLMCKFGTCITDHKGTYIAYSCDCDKGALGIFCEHKCCLDCGENGSCQRYNNGTQFCNCKMGYNGGSCQYKQTAEQTLDNGLTHYKWALLMGLLIVGSFIMMTSLTLYLIWRRWWGGKGSVIQKLRCQSKTEDSSCQYDVLLLYHNNETDDKFAKEVVLPVIEQTGLTVCLLTHPFPDSQGKEQSSEIIEKYLQCITIYTPNFITNCSGSERAMYKKYHAPFKKGLVYLCTKQTFSSFHMIRKWLTCFLSGYVYINCPCTNEEQDVKRFQETLKENLPKRYCERKSIATADCV